MTPYRDDDDAIDHLTLCFGPGANVKFVPETADPARLARRFERIIELLNESPERILCAAGACSDHESGGVH